MPFYHGIPLAKQRANLGRTPARVVIYDLPVGAQPYSVKDPVTGQIVGHEPIDKKPAGTPDSVVVHPSPTGDLPWSTQFIQFFKRPETPLWAKVVGGWVVLKAVKFVFKKL
jgi:hypothetical protein